MSLRAELIGAAGGMPGFAVLLPAGWEATDAGSTGLRDRLDAVLDGFPVATRATVRARIEEMMATARAEAARADVVRVFAPASLAPEDYLPVSLVASWLHAPAGGTAATIGSGLIATRGAVPLDPGGTILRWSTAQKTIVEGGEVDVAGSGYLLQVPGHPSTGLLVRSQILRGVGDAVLPAEGEQMLSLLCDAIVASVRWRRDG